LLNAAKEQPMFVSAQQLFKKIAGIGKDEANQGKE